MELDIDKIGEYSRQELREYYASHTIEDSTKMFRARALWEWRKKTKYCSCCGTELIESKDVTAMECPNCKQQIFPRIDPCIIVLIKRYVTDDAGNKKMQILLARHAQRNQDIYALIAGFVEAGEPIETTVKREIFEETGITVKNIEYRGSQSWPFPQQLMLAFHAEYESGKITLQEDEISDAQWFDPDNLPASPAPGSIAYQLIHGEV